MALLKKELYQLLQILSVPVKYDATVSAMTMALKMELARRRNESAPSSAYAQKDFSTQKDFSDQPLPYGGPTIPQQMPPYAPPLPYGGPTIPQQMPPYAPPLSDSDDGDIVVTVELM